MPVTRTLTLDAGEMPSGGLLARIPGGTGPVLTGREVVFVAVAGDRYPLDQLHDEIGPAGFRGAGIEDSRYIRMVHEGQRLPLGAEARDHAARVHSRFDHLDGHQTANGLELLGTVYRPEPTLSDPLDEPEAAGALELRLKAAVHVGRRPNMEAAAQSGLIEKGGSIAGFGRGLIVCGQEP